MRKHWKCVAKENWSKGEVFNLPNFPRQSQLYAQRGLTQMCDKLPHKSSFWVRNYKSVIALGCRHQYKRN